MLILSSLGISIALIGMGVYFYLKSLEKLECMMHELVLSNNSTETNVLLSTASAESLKSEETNLTEKSNCHATYTENIGMYTNYTHTSYNTSALRWHLYTSGWLPMLILMVYILFFNLGYGAMIWITVVEILPLHVRSVATSLSVGFTCVCSFLTSHTYNDLKSEIKGMMCFFCSREHYAT